jgi:mannuronan 5-epimerase
MKFTRIWTGFISAMALLGSVSATELPYQISVGTEGHSEPVTLPDISGYTEAAIQHKLAPWLTRQGHANEERMSTSVETRKFFLGGRLSMWGERQGRFPRVLFVRGGLMRLSDLAAAFPQDIQRQPDHSYHLRLPLIIAADGALLIGPGETLRMIEERGAFLVNAGNCFVLRGGLLGWREEGNQPALFSGDKHKFRPFYTAWSGSETYMFGSEIAHLGSATSKAYGFSLSAFSKDDEVYAPKGMNLAKRPTGWLVENHVYDMFYGFYSYEADDVVILRNRYVDNYYYGIDPHDRSRRLIIAENRVWGTKVRHGIIGSREVDDSFIFRNVSFNNHLSGIMLDRLSNRNLVAYNVTYGNGSDGIAMYESHNNLLYANQVFENAHHGIRFRNSRDIRMVDNLILKNGRYGVYGHIKDLSYQTYRDFKLDPYEARSSAQLRGGLIGLNKSGAVFVDDTERLQLSNLRLEENGGTMPLRGDLRSQAAEILLALQQSNAQVQLTQTPAALP